MPQARALREIEERLTAWVSAQLAEAFPNVFLVEARMRVYGPEIHGYALPPFAWS
ncbi:MAG: hypothetical protein ABDH91_06345 [Bacteroidia bacterium]